MDVAKAKWDLLAQQDAECIKWLNYWAGRQERVYALQLKLIEDMQASDDMSGE